MEYINLDEKDVLPFAYDYALENAIDCLVYGCSKKNWDSCGLPPQLAERCWKEAVLKLEREDF